MSDESWKLVSVINWHYTTVSAQSVTYLTYKYDHINTNTVTV